MSKSLEDVIYEAGPRADPAPIAAAIRAAGYKSPDEIRAELDAQEEIWRGHPLSDINDAESVIDHLRATLLSKEP